MGSAWSFISIPQWYSYGGRHFGKSGFRSAKAKWDAAELRGSAGTRTASLESQSRPKYDGWARGKTILVTGANSGLGYETSMELARREADVVMVCRSAKRAEEAAVAIEKEVGRKPRVELCDLSSKKSIREFSAKWSETGVPVDAIVNNAGLMLKEYTATDEGLETVFATMAGGSYFMTLLMLPHLLKGDPSRVISVTSAGGYMVQAQVPLLNMPPESYSDLFAYSHSKRVQIEITDKWSSIFDEEVASSQKSDTMPAGLKPVSFMTMHPGWAATPGLSASMPSFSESADLRSQAEGADSILWLLDIPDRRVSKFDGELVFDREATFKHFSLAGTSISDGQRDKLWQQLDNIFEVDSMRLIKSALLFSREESMHVDPKTTDLEGQVEQARGGGSN